MLKLFHLLFGRLRRQPKHLLAFLLAELGTNGSIDGNNQLIIKGRFQQKQIETVLRRYISKYIPIHLQMLLYFLFLKRNTLLVTPVDHLTLIYNGRTAYSSYSVALVVADVLLKMSNLVSKLLLTEGRDSNDILSYDFILASPILRNIILIIFCSFFDYVNYNNFNVGVVLCILSYGTRWKTVNSTKSK